MRSKETDTRRIAQRRKQIDLGKSTRGYGTYTSIVPKGKRRPDLAFSNHPMTPDPLEKCSKRRFDGKLRVWRRGIHSFEEAFTTGMATATADGGDVVVGASEEGAPTAGPSSLSGMETRRTTAPGAAAAAATAANERQTSADERTSASASASAIASAAGARQKRSPNVRSIGNDRRAAPACSVQHEAVVSVPTLDDVRAAASKNADAYAAKQQQQPPKPVDHADTDVLCVVASVLSPIQEDGPAKRYTVAPTKTTKDTAKAKFETPRKKLAAGGGKSRATRRPGSSGKENFALSQSAKKRRAAAALRELDVNVALDAAETEAFSREEEEGGRRRLSHRFAAASGGGLRAKQLPPTGVVCSGGVCALPDARTGAYVPREGLKTRAVLREMDANNVGFGVAACGKDSHSTFREGRDVFPIPRDLHSDLAEQSHHVYEIGSAASRTAAAKRLSPPPPPTSRGAEPRGPLDEFIRMNAAASAAGAGAAGGGGTGGESMRPNHGSANPLRPKCALFNDGACTGAAATGAGGAAGRCEYRHEAWTVAERVEHEARRAFADNSRLLEQNSVLLNRMREQDLLITDQGQEITSLLDEIHRLRLASSRSRRSGVIPSSGGGGGGALSVAASSCSSYMPTTVPRTAPVLPPLDTRTPHNSFASATNAAPAITTAAASAAATIAATALRRTPIRSRASRASFSRCNSLHSARTERTDRTDRTDRDRDLHHRGAPSSIGESASRRNLSSAWRSIENLLHDDAFPITASGAEGEGGASGDTLPQAHQRHQLQQRLVGDDHRERSGCGGGGGGDPLLPRVAQGPRGAGFGDRVQQER